MSNVEPPRVYAGGLIADGPSGCVGRCTCGWRSGHSYANGPAFRALIDHLTKGDHLATDRASRTTQEGT